jgi:hypothetical protein
MGRQLCQCAGVPLFWCAISPLGSCRDLHTYFREILGQSMYTMTGSIGVLPTAAKANTGSIIVN